jgi:hypothetical protein
MHFVTQLSCETFLYLWDFRQPQRGGMYTTIVTSESEGVKVRCQWNSNSLTGTGTRPNTYKPHRKEPCVVAFCYVRIKIRHQITVSYCIRGKSEYVSKTLDVRNSHGNAHGRLGSYITSKGDRVKKESHFRTVRDSDVSLLVKLLYFAPK